MHSVDFDFCALIADSYYTAIVSLHMAFELMPALERSNTVQQTRREMEVAAFFLNGFNSQALRKP